MTQQAPNSPYEGIERSKSHGHTPSGSKQPGKPGTTEQRAPRVDSVDTRSIQMPWAALLERKRANNRDAQPALRKRTNDYIDNLENTLLELQRSQEVDEQETMATRQHHRGLKEKNAYLRARFIEAGLANDLPSQRKVSERQTGNRA